MQVVGKDNTIRPCVATIGTFDGVHRGHQFVVQQVVNQARERGLDAVVLTFPNHPLQVLRENFQPQMLTLSDEKERLLQQTGADRVVLMDFTKELAGMTARDFMQTILKERLNAQVLLMGYDNHFGHDRLSFADCQQCGRTLGIEVIGCEEYHIGESVVQGFQNGRKLGYPTANLQVNPAKLIPENGAYLVKCQFSAANSQLSIFNFQLSTFFGMLNVGTRPTLHNGRQRSIEVHLFDFDGDLYGQTLTIELLHHLRKEQEFDTLEALQQQLSADEAQCRALLAHA